MKIEYVRNGRQRTVNAKVGKLLIGRGLARAVDDASPVAAGTYQTRDMRAAPAEAAPYGYKADGTPRKRPGRQAVKSDDTAEAGGEEE